MNLTEHRKKQIARLQILLKELNATDYKREIYAEYGVTSSRDMTDGQLSDLIARLESTRNVQRDEAVRTLRHNVLNLLTEMGVYYRDNGDSWDDVWRRVNEFLCGDKIAGKALYALSVPELQSLIRKLRSMQAKGYRYTKPSERPSQPPQAIRIAGVMGRYNPGVVN